MATAVTEPTVQYTTPINSARATLVTPKGDTLLPCAPWEWQPGVVTASGLSFSPKRWPTAPRQLALPSEPGKEGCDRLLFQDLQGKTENSF